MTTTILPNRILIVEPDHTVLTPYIHLGFAKHITRIATIDDAIQELQKGVVPDLALISATFSAMDSLELLETLKKRIKFRIIPVVFVVNLANPISTVLGTHWGNKIGILHTLSTQEDINLTFEKIFVN